ncbi:MAG TPA: Hsp20/alpha crystallin family protein [Azospirillaceae bacterium]|nr:Hsp20/alpha crystallin family protein [Azospirillaceae bacterium]
MNRRSMMPSLFGAPLPASRGGDPFLTLHREMNRLFDDIMRGFPAAVPDPTAPNPAMLTPSMDVSETDREIKVCADLPGVSPDDVEVTLEGDMLTIRGERKAATEDKGENWHLVERSHGSFTRTIPLPFRTDPNAVQADFEHGVLTITLPKPEANPANRTRIQVRAGTRTTDTQDDTGLSGAADAIRAANAADGAPIQDIATTGPAEDTTGRGKT